MNGKSINGESKNKYITETLSSKGTKIGMLWSKSKGNLKFYQNGRDMGWAFKN